MPVGLADIVFWLPALGLGAVLVGRVHFSTCALVKGIEPGHDLGWWERDMYGSGQAPACFDHRTPD